MPLDLHPLSAPPSNAREVQLVNSAGAGRGLWRHTEGLWFQQQMRDYRGLWILVWWECDPTTYALTHWKEVRSDAA